MRALILTDEFFASRERALLLRLEVGLADDGVQVIHAVPEGTKTAALGSVCSKVLTYSPKTLLLTRPLAIRRLMRSIAEVDNAVEPDEIDIVHVFGGSAWRLGAEIAAEVGAGLALEVWRVGLIEKARNLKLDDDEPLLIAPDPAIERALLDAAGAVGGPPTRLAAWGVVAPSAPRDIFDPARAPSVMLVGSGRDARSFGAALEGLAAVAHEVPDLLIFCDALAARRAGLWALARRLGILENLSLIEEFEGRRDLLLHGDVLLQPEAHGEQRSILLEAMASGMVVIAAADPMVSSLQEGRTARLVRHNDQHTWREVIREMMSNPERSRALGDSARAFIREYRRASDHVRAVLGAYEWLTSDEPIPFKGS